LYQFIVNRHSGNGRSLRVWAKLEPLLRQKGVAYEAAVTSTPEEAGDVVRSLSERGEPVAAVVVVGGDGTVQSILHELVEAGLPLAVVPGGSGNDLARGLRLARRPKDALEQILAGVVRRVDVIRKDGRRCVTIVGAGFDGEIARTVNRAPYKRWLNRLRLGPLAYYIGVLQVLFSFRPRDATLVVDGASHTFRDVWLVAAANFPSYGGGMCVCPHADASDGVLEVCVLRGVTRLQLLTELLPKVRSGRHLRHPGVVLLRGRRIGIVADSGPPFVAHGDGEMFGEGEHRLSVEPGALLVISPGSPEPAGRRP
jgi:diacylglycerol kinase (ATP)